MKQRDGLFFYFMVAVGPQRLRDSQLSYFLQVRERPHKTAVNYIHLSNIAHLPSEHLLFNSSTPLSPQCVSSSEAFMVDGWWISGCRELRGVRGDQIWRLNISIWLERGRGGGGGGGGRKGKKTKRLTVLQVLSEKRRQQVRESACFIRSAICQRVSSISCTRGSPDSLFTWLKVSGVSRTETLQNCSMLIPLCSVSSPQEPGGLGPPLHTFTWINRELMCGWGKMGWGGG